MFPHVNGSSTSVAVMAILTCDPDATPYQELCMLHGALSVLGTRYTFEWLQAYSVFLCFQGMPARHKNLPLFSE